MNRESFLLRAPRYCSPSTTSSLTNPYAGAGAQQQLFYPPTLTSIDPNQQFNAFASTTNPIDLDLLGHTIVQPASAVSSSTSTTFTTTPGDHFHRTVSHGPASPDSELGSMVLRAQQCAERRQQDEQKAFGSFGFGDGGKGGGMGTQAVPRILTKNNSAGTSPAAAAQTQQQNTEILRRLAEVLRKELHVVEAELDAPASLLVLSRRDIVVQEIQQLQAEFSSSKKGISKDANGKKGGSLLDLPRGKLLEKVVLSNQPGVFEVTMTKPGKNCSSRYVLTVGGDCYFLPTIQLSGFSTGLLIKFPEIR